MNDQRIGRDGENFIKNKKGQQIGCKTDADGAAETHGKGRKISRLVFLFVSSHIADGIDRGENPKARSDTAEDHPSAVHLQLQADTAGDFKENDVKFISG